MRFRAEGEGLNIYVVGDASMSGGGGYICQGKTLETAKLAVYHSRVFNATQAMYPVHEQELLATEDIIKTHEHWLIGRRFIVVTDSQAMLSLMKQKHLSPHQWRSVTYLSKFDISFQFIPGKKNIIADLLSRISERSTYRPGSLPYLEEDDSHLAAIQLRRGKTQLETPFIKKRTPKVESHSHSQDESSGLTMEKEMVGIKGFLESFGPGIGDRPSPPTTSPPTEPPQEPPVTDVDNSTTAGDATYLESPADSLPHLTTTTFSL
jgi:RNase H-like domain found in reverse transcriptase